ncbi:MAG: LysR family transcriptional regulator [Betaproteobacteria bacterium]|nr:MAG: LysR family transcriptional regulator [Betaproteobacteria bacterium]
MNRSEKQAGSPQTRFPSIDALRAFEALTRLGSYDKAAAELSITTSAVSKRIASLESLVGATLFDRSGRSLVVTAAGKEYVEQVRSVLSQFAAIGLHQRTAQSQTRLRVLATPTFAREILVPNLGRFTAAHDECEVEIVVAIPYLDMAVPDSDVAVSFGPRFVRRGNDAPAQEPLLFEPVFAVASPAIAKKFRLRKPADVLRTPLIRCPIEPWLPWFSAAKIDSPEPASGVKLVDLGLSLEAAASGQGVALARASIVRRWLERGELVDLFEVRAAPHSGYSLTVHRAGDVALDFAKWLRDLCARLERSSHHR